MNLEGVRKKNNLTQEEMSRKLGVSQQSISKYENGTRKLPVDVAKRIGKLFDVEWADLYEEDE